MRNATRSPWRFAAAESQIPYGIEIEPAGLLLHVAPVATDIKHIDKRKTGHLLHMIFQRLAAFAHGDGRSALLPRITKQPKPRVAKRLLRWRRIQNGLPTFILVDVEWTLVQAIFGCEVRGEIITLPQVLWILRKRMNAGQKRH